MPWFSELSFKVKAMFGLVVGFATLLGAMQVAEPYVPALRGWVREYFEESRAPIKAEQDKQIAEIKIAADAAIAKMSLKLELIDQGQIENRLTTLEVMLAALRSELTEMVLRQQKDSTDMVIARRKDELAAQISRVELQRDDLECLLDRKRGIERPCQ